MTLDISPTTDDRLAEILSDDAVAFVSELHERFGTTRNQLLQARAERGAPSDFLAETREIREDTSWSVRRPRADYEDRRVEITHEGERVVGQDPREAVVGGRGDVQRHGRLPRIEWSSKVMGW